MKCETIQNLLDDYVDRRLIGEEPALVESHLAACPWCAQKAEALRALIRRASALPRDISPPRDLWPGIHQRLAAAPSGAVRATVWRPALAFAAAVLLLLSGGLLVLTMPRVADPDFTPGQAPSRLAWEVRAAEAEYAQARRDLLAAMDQNESRLAPETRRVVEENLAIIDGAIEQIRASLQKDPENDVLFHMLVAEQDRSLRLIELRNSALAETW